MKPYGTEQSPWLIQAVARHPPGALKFLPVVKGYWPVRPGQRVRRHSKEATMGFTSRLCDLINP